MKKKVIKRINCVLADWNPIGVPENMVIEEYKAYIPLVLQFIKNRQELMDCLEDILINQLGLDYNPSNKEQFEDLNKVCDKLIFAYQEMKNIED